MYLCVVRNTKTGRTTCQDGIDLSQINGSLDMCLFVSCICVCFVFILSRSCIHSPNPPTPPHFRLFSHGNFRWATVMGHRLLTSHEPELNSLMKSFREGQSVGECVGALEGARAD